MLIIKMQKKFDAKGFENNVIISYNLMFELQ